MRVVKGDCVDFAITADKRIRVLCIFFSTVWRVVVLSRMVRARFSRRGFSVLTDRKPPCIDTWGTESTAPPPKICERWCPVVCRTVAVWPLLPSNLHFIPGSICSPVTNITFFTLFTLNFKLKGIFDLTFSFPSHYKHLWLLWKDAIQFHLVHRYMFF